MSIKEALDRLLTSAKILQQNAEGCAVSHYGADFQQEGLPGWLRDTKADIDAAQSALASLSCGEARERIARIIHPVGFEENSMERVEVVAAYQKEALAKADAILATGLVPDEAAIRADWHTTGWDRARNSGRILLVWREFAGVREHVELGRYSDSRTAWVNTYGRPFHCEPDGWAPLLPFATETAIRADEREKCARVAERTPLNSYDAGECRADIAAAIRAGGDING